MSKDIKVTGALVFPENVPTRAGEVVNSVGEIYDIPAPRVGMIVYDKSTGINYIVRSLKAKVIDGVQVDNAQVDEYEELDKEVFDAIANETLRAKKEEFGIDYKSEDIIDSIGATIISKSHIIHREIGKPYTVLVHIGNLPAQQYKSIFSLYDVIDDDITINLCNKNGDVVVSLGTILSETADLEVTFNVENDFDAFLGVNLPIAQKDSSVDLYYSLVQKKTILNAIAEEAQRAEDAEKEIADYLESLTFDITKLQSDIPNIKNQAARFDGNAFSATANEVKLTTTGVNTSNQHTVSLPTATTETAGVMSAEDKAKLDSLSQGGGGSAVAELMQSVTYSELVALRDTNKLVAGTKYRITDYVTTTVQKDTKSANHPFDVIVEAISENELSELAQAIQHEGDTYFDGNDLGAWQLWYDLDNNTEKYEWADAENGKGVIYRMIDEKRNDCPYDFKNIQFIRYELNAPDVGGYTYEWQNKMSENINIMFEKNQLSYIWHGNNNEDDYYWENDMGEVISSPTGETKAFFTFSNVINDVVTDKSKTSVCYSNIIKESRDGSQLKLNNIVFFSIDINAYCSSNSFDNDCYSNSFGNYCYSNSFGNDCNSNSFGNDCNSNSFGNDCNSNSFRDGPAYAFNEDYWEYSYDDELIDGVRGNKFGDRCQNLLIHTLATTGEENSIQNLIIAQGLCSIELDDNDTFIPLPIEIDIVGQNYELKIGRDSNDEIKVYCEADLV